MCKLLNTTHNCLIKKPTKKYKTTEYSQTGRVPSTAIYIYYNTGWVEDEQHFCVECPALEEARAPLLHLLNLHHVDSGAVSDEDKFISIMQSPDSRTAKLLYNMFLKRSS